MANFDLGKILMEIELIGKRKAKSELDDFSKGVDKTLVGLKRVINTQVQLDKQRKRTAKEAQRAEDLEALARNKAEQSYRRLAASIDPVVKAKQDLARVEAQLNDAVKRGIITTQQATRTLADYRRQAVANGVAFDKFGQVVDVVGRRTKKFASAGLQQAGYQIGDFAVQVQSGTNVAVAFGQQMSQLLGILGPYGALAGAGIAIGTAFVAPLLRGREEAQGLNKDFNELFDNFKENGSTMQDLLETSLSGPLEKARRQLVALRESFTEIDNQILADKVTETAVPFIKQLSDMRDEFLKVAEPSGGAFSTAAPNSVLGRMFGGEERSPEDRAGATAAAQEIADLMLQLQAITKGPVEDMDTALVDFYVKLVDSNTASKDMLLTFKNMLRSTGLLASAEAKVFEAQEKKRKEAEAEDRRIKKRARENAAYFDEQEKLLAERERRRIDETFKGETALMNQQVAISSDVQVLIDKRLEREKRAMDERFKGEAALFEQAVEISDDLLKKIEEDAKKAAKAYETAFNATSFLFANRFQDETDLMNMPVAIDPNNKPPKKKKKPKAPRDPLAELQKQLDLEAALVGKTEARQRVVRALGLTFSEANPKVVNGLISQIQATEKLIEAEKARAEAIEAIKQQQEDMRNTIESSMENAFMSMIDGTKSVKDAFREMAREIIAELFRIYVVKKAVSAVTSFLPFEKGGAFHNGNVIPFASGGVVNTPTYFPMSRGRTGLMGEAGPEAIMPLKRGSDGKLGVQAEGSGAVTIHQTFNFAANGDDSVKRIIVQSMPQITEAAKSGVLDARKRGGSFRKVFA